MEAYDVRPAVKEQVESLGAKFVELPLETAGAEDKGGYAKAQDEGAALIRAGVNKRDPSRLLRFIACIVPPGTKAVTTTARIFSHDIRVIEGEHDGCVGNVPTEVFKRE